jgi:putative transposase
MSVRDIMHHLEQVYGTQLSHETVSRITDAVLEEVRAWQSRPLDPVYAAVFLDAIVVKVRDNQVVQNKPAYIAIGAGADGEKHVLGIWLAKTPPQTATAGEGARFWGSVMADLKNRGVRDILIACVDGLAGFEDAITSAFPHAVVQRCVVHLIRNSLRPVARRDADEVAKELRKIYTAPTAEAAFDALAAFAASPWGRKYPQAARVWEDAWDAFTPFLAFTPGPARHRMARGPQRARHRLPRAHKIRPAKHNNSKKFTHLKLQALIRSAVSALRGLPAYLKAA